tara:strand:- start:1254 stop:1613 length:360 start_codon:yes stop_codon:yes gene_type:complete
MSAQEITQKRRARGGLSRASRNRKLNQDSLRELLRGQALIQHMLTNIKNMKTEECSDAFTLARELAQYKSRLSLLNKILPDLKAIELSSEITQLPDIQIINWEGDNESSSQDSRKQLTQ